LHQAKKQWVCGRSFWSHAAEPYSGVAVLFKTNNVTVKRVVEVEQGRCMVLDVLLNEQSLRLINVYGPQTKGARKELFNRIKPFLFTAQPVVFVGDFNTVCRPMDRGGAAGRWLGYDSISLNSIVREAGLEDVHIRHRPNHTGFTFFRGSCRSRIDRFFVKEGSVVSPPEVIPVEFSDHCMVRVFLNVSQAAQRGKGLWRLNSALLGKESVKQSFLDFFQAQESLVGFCNTRAEWWEMVKKRAVKLFRGLANKIQIDKERVYQSLRRKLDRLVSDGGPGGEVAKVRALMREYQYDRLSSLVQERDYGKYHSPDPFQNCQEASARRSVHGLRNEDGVLNFPDMKCLGGTPGIEDVSGTLDELDSEITVDEVRKAADSLNLKKTPGPDGLTAEFYKEFLDLLAPPLIEIFNSSLGEGLLPPSMRCSALILLSKGLDQTKVDNWRPIALLNTDRKILAKVMFNRLFSFSERLLSPSQHCTVEGRSCFSAVLGIREVLERRKACEWDDVTVIVSCEKEAETVAHVLEDYSRASGSLINRSKCEAFWLGKGDPAFVLPDVFPEAQSQIKILGITFDHGDYAKLNWEKCMGRASYLVNRWKVLTYLIPVFLYVSYTCLLPESLYGKISGLFFQLLWGNRTNLIKRNVTYLQRSDGGLSMINPVVFFVNTFVKYNFSNLLDEKAPLWVEIFKVWVSPFLKDWLDGGSVKSVRAPRGSLPLYVTVGLKILRKWCVTVGEIRTAHRREIDRTVLSSYFHAPLALRDCPNEMVRSGLSLVNSQRLYVNWNLKYRRSDDRGCPREECAGKVETMDHFLLQCPFNIDVYKQVSQALGIPCLSGWNYQEWAYGAVKRH
ncbi:hypothetical protein XELAEV_18034023mg, partial [Xenopus laevis]